ncbi:putative holin-like toxin [Sporolactobacillus inulinus]
MTTYQAISLMISFSILDTDYHDTVV